MIQESTRKQHFSQRRHRNIFLWILAIFLATGCKKEMEPNNDEIQNAASSAKASPTLTVSSGASIQAAINTAAFGSIIKIKPGIYKESIKVNKPNLTIIGEGKVIIENPGGAEIGILVEDAADGFTLKKVTIQGFTERAVNMTYVDGFLFSGITVINSGEFGLFSEYCKNGTIELCETTGMRETGVFVGQSSNVTVSQNKSYANVIGLEVENSSQVTLDKNHIYDNAVGIMCLLVPGRNVKQSSGIVLTKNQVIENNHVNFSAPPEQESVLPSGIGILIVGTDNMLVEGNHVTANQFTGIAVVSSLIIGALAGIPDAAFADIEPNPDGVKVISNKVEENGFNPPLGLPLPPVDLLWDGTGNQNCWLKNVFATSFPSPLPACQ